METTQKNDMFSTMPVKQAVIKNVVPAMLAMLMTLVYNLADTFFIGQTHNAYMVASVSLAAPVFLIFMSIGNIFGIGGTSVISRALGAGKKEYAKKVCSFCMWMSVAAGIVLSALFLLFMDKLLSLIGVQPLLGFCTGAKNWGRYHVIMKFSLFIAFVISFIMTVLCYIFIQPMTGVFLSDKNAFEYGVRFAKILLTTSSFFGVFFVFANALQALGAATASLIVNLSRQGLIYIPFLFLLNALLGSDGLMWAQPVADMLSLAMALMLYRRFFSGLKRK